MRAVVAVAAIAATAFVAPRSVAAAPELVLQEGVRLTATTPSGTVGVVAGEGLRRTYEWNGCSLEAAMMARSTRWYGALGMYDPAGRGPVGMLFGSVFGCKGISRPVVQEAQAHFATRNAAESWIEQRSRLPFDTVWTHDGLFLQWGVTPDRQQLNVDLWQICIAGSKPTELRGAGDAIQVTRVSGSGELRHDCAPVGPEAMIGR